jgi:hypothetical protein
MSADTPTANIVNVTSFNRVILVPFRLVLFVITDRAQFCLEALEDFGQSVGTKGIATIQMATAHT